MTGCFWIPLLKLGRKFLIYIIAFRVIFWVYGAYFLLNLAMTGLHNLGTLPLYLAAVVILPIKALVSLTTTAIQSGFFQTMGTSIIGLLQMLDAAICATALAIAQVPAAIFRTALACISGPASPARLSEKYQDLTPIEESYAAKCNSRAGFEVWLEQKRQRDAEDQRKDMELARVKFKGVEWEGMWDFN